MGTKPINLSAGMGHFQKNAKLRVSYRGVVLYAHKPGAAEPNLRFATVFWRNAQEILLELRPFGDGILSLDLKDCNDWRVMERGLCSSLRASCTDPFCLAYGEANSCLGWR